MYSRYLFQIGGQPMTSVIQEPDPGLRGASPSLPSLSKQDPLDKSEQEQELKEFDKMVKGMIKQFGGRKSSAVVAVKALEKAGKQKYAEAIKQHPIYKSELEATDGAIETRPDGQTSYETVQEAKMGGYLSDFQASENLINNYSKSIPKTMRKGGKVRAANPYDELKYGGMYQEGGMPTPPQEAPQEAPQGGGIDMEAVVQRAQQMSAEELQQAIQEIQARMEQDPNNAEMYQQLLQVLAQVLQQKMQEGEGQMQQQGQMQEGPQGPPQGGQPMAEEQAMMRYGGRMVRAQNGLRKEYLDQLAKSPMIGYPGEMQRPRMRVDSLNGNIYDRIMPRVMPKDSIVPAWNEDLRQYMQQPTPMQKQLVPKGQMGMNTEDQFNSYFDNFGSMPQAQMGMSPQEMTSAKPTTDSYLRNLIPQLQAELEQARAESLQTGDTRRLNAAYNKLMEAQEKLKQLQGQSAQMPMQRYGGYNLPLEERIFRTPEYAYGGGIGKKYRMR